VLALATLAAVIFALINFDQRSRFEVVYDGVAWLDTDHGIQASRISPNSPQPAPESPGRRSADGQQRQGQKSGGSRSASGPRRALDPGALQAFARW